MEEFTSELIITKWHDKLTAIGIIDNGVELIKVLEDNSRLGNIYLGRVENKVSNLDAYFVRFESGNDKHGIGFLPIKAILPECVLNREIEDASKLRPGDEVLVQIKTEEQKTKQAKLTTKIDFELTDYEDTLENLISTARTRTLYNKILDNSEDIEKSVLNAKAQLERLVLAPVDYKAQPEHLMANSGDAETKIDKQVLDFARIKIISDIHYICEELQKNDIPCEYYDKEEKRLDLNVFYSLSAKTDDLFKKKVYLKSGSYLYIEQTETLNLIDVNSGKNLKKSDSFFLELNKEAAREAYRQIRLRNLTGMILIDFVSMKSSEMNEEFIEFIKDLIRTDNLNMRFIDLTGLGIMEFTRDKNKKSLRETIDIKHM